MSWWEQGKTFPVAGAGITIPWSVAEEAYLAYNPRGTYSQTLLRLAERGGFHVSELDEYVPDWREKASEITALRAQVAQLQEQLEAARGVVEAAKEWRELDMEFGGEGEFPVAFSYDEAVALEDRYRKAQEKLYEALDAALTMSEGKMVGHVDYGRTPLLDALAETGAGEDGDG